jgi:hypothetical protein
VLAEQVIETKRMWRQIMSKETSKNTSLYSTLKLTNYSIRARKLTEGEKLRSKEWSACQADMYGELHGQPANVVAGHHIFPPLKLSFGQKQVVVWRKLVACNFLTHYRLKAA